MHFSNNFHLSRLSYYSLIGLALLPLTRFFDLNFWDIVRLSVITVGLVWLLKRRVQVFEASKREGTFELLLLSLVFMFILARFIGYRQEDGWTGVVGGVLVVVSFVGVCVARVSPFVFSRVDRTVFCIAAGVVILKVFAQLAFSSYGPSQRFFRWTWTLQVAEFLGVYFAISRMTYFRETRYFGRRLLSIIVLVIGLVSLGGIYRTCVAFYSSTKALQTFKAGDYDRAQEYMSQLREVNTNLKFPLTSMGRTLTQMVDVAGDLVHRDAYMAAGEIAEAYHVWDLALKAYRGALEAHPDSPKVRAALGNSLLENGLQEEALEVCREPIEQPGATPGDYAALGLVLAKMGRWMSAYDVLSQAIDLDASTVELGEKLSSGNGVVSVELGHLFSESFIFCLKRLTMFEVAQLLKARGWKVFYPAMELGSTGVPVPVDIVAVSGAGTSFIEESIRVKGEEFSLRKRGYNLVVVGAKTGRVEKRVHFDTWENISDAHRLADYLQNIPQGKIVIATINDEGSKELTDQAKASFQTIGINRFPQKWWSHALIGVKGVSPGETVQRIAEQNGVAVVGVLSGNIDLAAAENPVRLEEMLRKGAHEASAGMAVFIPHLKADAKIILAQSQPRN